MNGNIQAFIRELRRRRVLRGGALYIVGAWVLIQVAEILLNAWTVPPHALRYVVIGAVIGFPIALLLAWRYDITAQGIVRTPRASEPVTTGLRGPDYAIFGALLVVLAVLVYGLFERIQTQPIQSADPATGRAADPEIPLRSIAVLPFSDASAADENAAFLAMGIHSDLLTLLSKVRDIKVISDASAGRYGGAGQDLPRIGRELRVATIMTGGVQQATDQVRINVQLVEASSGEQLWAERYDRQLSAASIFAVQTEIAESILNRLKATLTPEEQALLAAPPTENLEAYRAYAFGRQLLARRKLDELERAAGHFARATELDPDYALAYVGRHGACRLLAAYGASASPHCTGVRFLLKRALELEPDLGEAHAGVGWERWQQGDFAGAERAFRRAIELSPNYPTAYQWYGSMLGWRGVRSEEALALHLKALQLDPLSLIVHINVSVDYADLGRFKQALQHALRTVEIDPGFAQGYQWVGDLQNAAFGRPEEAIAWSRRAADLDPDYYWPPAHLGLVYMDLGDGELADRHVADSLALSPRAAAPLCTQMLLQLRLERRREATSLAPDCLRAGGQAVGTWKGQWQTFALAVLRDADRATGRPDDSIERYGAVFPGLLAEDPEIDRTNFRAAVDLALVLRESGRDQAADVLLARSLALIQTLPRLWTSGYQVKDAEVYALQGRADDALTALRQAVDQGWRRFWWYAAEHQANFAAIRQRPEFVALMAEIESDMGARLERMHDADRPGLPAGPAMDTES